MKHGATVVPENNDAMTGSYAMVELEERASPRKEYRKRRRNSHLWMYEQSQDKKKCKLEEGNS